MKREMTRPGTQQEYEHTKKENVQMKKSLLRFTIGAALSAIAESPALGSTTINQSCFQHVRELLLSPILN